MKKLFLISSALFFGILFVASCKKENKTQTGPNPTPGPDPAKPFYLLYSYSGDGMHFTGDTIQFIKQAYIDDSAIDSSFKLCWYFGDGDSSVLQNPVHVYTAAGVYTIDLRAEDKSIKVSTIKKTIDVYKDPLYTYMLCKMRTWTGGKRITTAVSYYDSISLADSTFAISYVSKIAISVWGQTLVYSPDHSSTNMLVYDGKFGMIYYYPVEDSVSLDFTYYYGSHLSPPFYRYCYHSP